MFGEIPERSNGADCKSVGEAFGGSNPPLPTLKFLEIGFNLDQLLVIKEKIAEVAHLAER